MPTSTKCYTPIQGRIIRIVKLDTCGVVVTGTGAATIIIDGFTQVSAAAQFENGDTHFQRRADAQACVNEKDPDVLTRFQLTTDFCVIDPGLVATTVTGRLLTFSESPTGTGFAIPEGALTNRFSMEVWQGVAGPGACDPTTGLQRYVYNAFPNCGNAKIGDYVISIAQSALQIVSESKRVSPLWTLGASWLGAGAVQVIPDHWFQNLTTVAPPTASCGIQ
jgi:hypothetical protein